MKKNVKWTKEEENILKNIPRKELNIYKLSEILDRSTGSICKKIYTLLGYDLRNQIIGSKRRAINHYNLMLKRCNSLNKKDLCYKNINVKITKEEFIKWFMPKDFKGCSIDRIDRNKDYELQNMQVIPLSENISKDKIKAKDGYCECFRCKQVKPIEEFAVDKRRANGHATICKKCDVERKKKPKTSKMGSANTLKP